MKRLCGVVSIPALSFLFLLSSSAALRAQEEPVRKEEDLEDYQTRRVTRTVDGLNFDVEEDRPIVKQGGVYQPMDIDSYVSLKVKRLQEAMEAKDAALEERIARLEAALQVLQEGVPAAPVPEADDAS